MIISHYYKYIFIETPQTGCSAIRNELLESYMGEIILSKHSVYSEFLAIATKDERAYFVFSSIRNPIDKMTSTYVKLKNNHRNRYTDRLNFTGRQAIYDLRDKANYKSVVNKGLLYYEFLKMSNIPYDDISTLDHRKFNFVIRYENLNKDFKNVLIKIGINPVRDLPIYNNTEDKKHYLEYYEDDKTRLVAINKFIYFMNYWNYRFPDDWNNPKINIRQIVIWNFFHFLRIFSWRYLRKGLKDV